VIFPNINLTLETKFYQMNRLNKILKEQGRSQAYLSRELGKSANTINNWCRNVTQPSLIDSQQLADLLGCEISNLLEVEASKEKK
jgi:transcriptional regulator with XRE-family HTH domain